VTPIIEGQRMAFVGHDTFVNGVAINSTGTQIATTASDQTVRLWDINTGAELQQLGAPEYAHSDLGMGVAFSSD
ncbi:MAG TPA: hypothetical protein PLZ51_05310, partial [Aggregatilineales bacterium]|nr:hypothetical protein [Aggregatilineales bacterium]